MTLMLLSGHNKFQFKVKQSSVPSDDVSGVAYVRLAVAVPFGL